MTAALISAARAAAVHAHAPYSRFRVGAAVLLADGSIVPGCNFENASYGLTLCAETVALASVNAMGRLADVRAIAVAGGPDDGAGGMADAGIITPCGRCRQVIQEAADIAGCDLPVHCAAATGSEVETRTISELLPHAFGPAQLGLGR